jgi:heme exporter protein D
LARARARIAQIAHTGRIGRTGRTGRTGSRYARCLSIHRIAMRNLIDFSSWQGVLSTLLGLVVFTLVAVGIRLLVMQRVQQRRERQNRQINERLKTLIAAYKTLGGSFTGNLAVDPSHLRELRLRAAAAQAALDAAQGGDGAVPHEEAADADDAGSERRRRIRDAVEAALSDVILLGTQEQVQLAAKAAQDMVAGRTIETGALVRSLRVFIREVLDLEALPEGLAIPDQGPVRTAGTAGRAGAAGGAGGAGRGGGRGAGQGGGAGGMAAGGMLGLGAAHAPTPVPASDAPASDGLDSRQP